MTILNLRSREEERKQAMVCICTVLYNSASVRKYDVGISVRTKLLSGSHSVTYHCYLGSRSVNFFMGSRSVNEGYRNVISAQLGVPLSN